VRSIISILENKAKTISSPTHSEVAPLRKTSATPEVDSDTAENISDLDVTKIPSPVLARLIEEVRNEEIDTTLAYNRFHNRHNRSR